MTKIGKSPARRRHACSSSLLRGSCALQKVLGIFHCVSLNTADAEMAKDDEQFFSATASEDVRLGDLGYEQGEFGIKRLFVFLLVFLTMVRTQAVFRPLGHDWVQFQHCHLVRIDRKSVV